MAAEAHILHDAIGDVEENFDLIAAQRVGALGAGGGWWQLAFVAGRAVVIENHFAVEVFEVAHC